MMWKPIFLTLLLLSFTVAVAAAQAGDCPTAVEQALESVADLCTSLGRNSACYGSSRVNSTTFTQPPPENFFQTPGDLAELIQFREIYPQPLDEASGEFGVAVLNAQADLPNTLPGQGVIFLLTGDARLTNEVPQQGGEQSPFQSFYFLPGFARSSCYEAEPMLTIQTPGNTSVTINFNGVETEFSPSSLLTITPSVCTIHRGYITQRVGGEDVANLLTNQTVDIHIEPNGTIVVEGARGISEREYQRGLQVQAALNSLSAANDWSEQLINDPPNQFDTEPAGTVEAAETPLPTATEPTCTPYIVNSGDTLRRIAGQFNTTIEAIVQANQLLDPNLIRTGQMLCIPTP